MMSFEALDALAAFDAEMNNPIPTRGLPPDRLELLEELLLTWQQEPNQTNTGRILDEFPDPGPDFDL
jgi:hypothetical protein